MLERAGFKDIFLTTTFPTEIWIRFGLDHRKYPKIGRFTHRLRLRYEKKWGLKAFESYKKIFNKYGWGREIVAVGTLK